MDIQLVRELLKTKTARELTTYLTSGRPFDPPAAGGQQAAFDLAALLKPVEHADEYAMALRIRSYNDAQGELEGLQCDLCKNKGNIMVITENGTEGLVECSCTKRRRSILRAQRSGMGELLGKTLDNYDTSQPWQQTLLNGAKHYLAHAAGEWYMMTGQSGAGKTHLCAAIVNAYLQRGKSAIYMQWTSTVKEIKLHATEDYTEMMQKYAKTDVLYIDDLFKGKVTDADLTIAFEIINDRAIRPEAITVISTERSLDELIALDSATAGRIAQRCGRYIVNIKPDPAKNYRFQAVRSV